MSEKPGRCRCGKLGAWRRLGKSLCFDCTDFEAGDVPTEVHAAYCRSRGIDLDGLVKRVKAMIDDARARSVS